MQIQNTTQPTFGKLYMPKYETLVEKYGEKIANALEAQRIPAEKASKKYDVYIRHAWEGPSRLGVDFRVYPLAKKDNIERNLDDRRWGCMTPINELAKSIKSVIKKEKTSLLEDTLVENNLATQNEAASFGYHFPGQCVRLIRQLLIERELGNTKAQNEVLSDMALIRKTLAQHGLIKKGDYDFIPDFNLILKRMIKNNTPIKAVIEDLQNIGMYIPTDDHWMLSRASREGKV